MNPEATIREALRTRTPVALSYRNGSLRTVHPQVLYRSSAGAAEIDCYQVSGESRSGGPVPGWRSFELTEISGIKLLEGEYGPASGLNLQAAKYATVLAHI